MIFLSELKEKNEIQKLETDGIIVYHRFLSNAFPYKFTTEEIKDIKKSTEKKVFLSLLPLYRDYQFTIIEEVISSLKDLDGFLFQDLGLVNIFKKYHLEDKAIYYPGTFINNYSDATFLSELSLSHFVISREITLNDIDIIFKKEENYHYSYSIFGYQNMFYSFRKHFTNFISHYHLNLKLKDNYNLSLKEEMRDSLYPSLEDDYGFYLYRDKIQNGFLALSHFNKAEYLILNRIFINDEMYYDTIDLYNKKTSYEVYESKYGFITDNGYFYKPVGLFKEKNDE